MLGKRNIGPLGGRRRLARRVMTPIECLPAFAHDVSQALGTTMSSLNRRQVRRRSGGLIEFELAIQAGG